MTSDVPVVTPSYVSSAPKLDGNLTDPAWQGAGKIESFELIGGAGVPSQKTEVRLCYDRSNLYIAVECFEDRMDQVVAAHTADGAAIWTDDSVELFISPRGVADAGSCHQFVVNVAGARTHICNDHTLLDQTWRASTARLADRWIAEIAIPFSALGRSGKNETCWRANFGRNERPHEETSSWSPVRQFFATYSRFGKLIAPEARFRFATFRGVPFALKADSSAPSGAQPMGDTVVPLRASDYIIPEPQQLHRRPAREPFRINADTKIVVDDAAAEADMWTAGEINSAIEKLGGKRLGVLHSMALGSSPDKAANAIVVGETTRNRLLRAVCEADSVRVPKSPNGTDAYALDVLPERIVIGGSTQAGTYYGAQTLKQLLRKDAAGELTVPAVSISDFPRFPFRGVHLLSSGDALTYISKLIENVLAPLKINHIVLQTDKVAWKSHPEITDASNFMPREDVVKLIEVARRHHITVTPLVQSPGHLEWAFHNGKNLDFAEDPQHPYCYCMTNPKSYDFIFSIMDEAIELFGHPEYFHAGRDEFDMLGTMPCDDRCKAIGKEKLYAQDTLKIYEHLKSKGCKMMMWGDVLDKPVFKDHIDEMPKDILINDWRYAPSVTYPSVDFYQSHGFPVVGCTWYNTRNISTFSTYAAQKGIEGMLQTTWCGWASEQEILRSYADQVYAYILSAAWSWNPASPSVEDMPYRPNAVFQKMWQHDTRAAQPTFLPIRLDRFCNISRADSGKGIGWLGGGRGNDLSAMPDGLVEIDGTPFMILPGKLNSPAAIMLAGRAMPGPFPREVKGIAVDCKLSALNFLQGCAYAADKGAKVGQYVVHYEDGKMERIDLVYSTNTYAWDDQSAATSFAWRTRATDGRLVGVGDLRWRNPRPDVKVTSIDFIAEDTEASPFLVALTAER